MSLTILSILELIILPNCKVHRKKKICANLYCKSLFCFVFMTSNKSKFFSNFTQSRNLVQFLFVPFVLLGIRDTTSFFPLPIIIILLHKPISKQTAISKWIFLFGNIPISRDKQPDFRQRGWIILISSSILAVIVKYHRPSLNSSVQKMVAIY